MMDSAQLKLIAIKNDQALKPYMVSYLTSKNGTSAVSMAVETW